MSGCFIGGRVHSRGVVFADAGAALVLLVSVPCVNLSLPPPGATHAPWDPHPEQKY